MVLQSCFLFVLKCTWQVFYCNECYRNTNKCTLLPFSLEFSGLRCDLHVSSFINDVNFGISVLFFFLSNLTFFFQKKQREFEEYIRDKYITAKADFRTLLKETKFITYRCVQWNVSCLQFLSLLVLTRMAKAYFAFTHMLTLLTSKDKKKPTFIKDQRQPTHLYLTFFFFLRKGPDANSYFVLPTHPVF